MTDKLKAADGSDFSLKSPYGDELPQRGFDPGEDTYQVNDVQCTWCTIHSTGASRVLVKYSVSISVRSVS